MGPPPFKAERLKAVVLSHAHIDHSGYLPLLVKNHFRGSVHCTSGTADLLNILLLDSAHIQEEEADAANHHGYSKHNPALPLYTIEDAQTSLKQMIRHSYGKPFAVASKIKGIFRRSGHILGAATVELQIGRKKICRLVFSGDLGRWQRPIVQDPEFVPEADLLLLEATYGNRLHFQDTEEEFARIIHESIKRGGAIIVPSFAVGRAQELVWMIRKLEEEKKIPELPVYFDSPMAINVTELYYQHAEELDFDIESFAQKGIAPFGTKKFHLIRTPEESKAINRIEGAFIIISASGMATGGRVLHHLKQRLPDPKTTVMLPGHQAVGTRGRSLQEGAKKVRIHGKDISVRAKVELLDGLSAHADQNEILKWLSGFKKAPHHTYIVHGEPAAANELAEKIRKNLDWNVSVAQDRQTIHLSAD